MYTAINSWLIATFVFDKNLQKGRFKGRIGLCLWSSKRFGIKSCLLGGRIFAKSWKGKLENSKNVVRPKQVGLMWYKIIRISVFSDQIRPTFWGRFLFFQFSSYIFKDFAKIRPPSRQLWMLNLFELHKQRPIRPLKRPFWRFLSNKKVAISQLLIARSKNYFNKNPLKFCPLQKLCYQLC